MATRLAWFSLSSIGRPTGTAQMQLAHRDSDNQHVGGKSNGIGRSAIGEPGRLRHLRMNVEARAASRLTNPVLDFNLQKWDLLLGVGRARFVRVLGETRANDELWSARPCFRAGTLKHQGCRFEIMGIAYLLPIGSILLARSSLWTDKGTAGRSFFGRRAPRRTQSHFGGDAAGD